MLVRIADIEAEMARTQKNKATEHHLGTLKAKLAKLKTEVVLGSTKSGGKPGEGFDVTKSGDLRVGMVRIRAFRGDCVDPAERAVRVQLPPIAR